MSLRICKDCQHYRRLQGGWGDTDTHQCLRTKEEATDLVTGYVSSSGLLNAKTERSAVGACGVAGTFYIARDDT